MENINKRPSKGILKIPETSRSNSIDKDIKWDETNIQETLHPDQKDYGFDKIDEPATPYNYFHNKDGENSEEEDGNDPYKQVDLLEKVSRRIKEPPVVIEDENVEKLLNESKDLRAIDDSVRESDARNGSQSTDNTTIPSSADEPVASTSTSQGAMSSFELKRKRHYNEFHAVKLAKKLWEEENQNQKSEDE